MTAVMIALLAVAIALFAAFMSSKAKQRDDGKRRDGGDGGSTATDTGSRKLEENSRDVDSGGDSGAGGDGGGGGD